MLDPRPPRNPTNHTGNGNKRKDKNHAPDTGASRGGGGGSSDPPARRHLALLLQQQSPGPSQPIQELLERAQNPSKSSLFREGREERERGQEEEERERERDGENGAVDLEKW